MRKFACVLFALAAALGQNQTTKSFVGTITGFRPEKAEVEIRPDNASVVAAGLTVDTIAQRIAPGARDLKNAENIKITDLAIGDRVLATFEPGSQNLRRVVVMSASDIAKRNEADRLDWQKRGVAGLVTSRSANRITVKTHTISGESEAVISIDDATNFKRYAPDSVKFTEAKSSRVNEVNVGDQLRARGEKTADGLAVKAQEVVFGTFVIKAGTITAVNPEARQITIKELGSNKYLTVALTADSQLKQMPSFPGGMMGGPARGGSPGPPAGGMPGGMASGGALPGRGMAGGPPGGFDINQMIDRIPATKLDDLKIGSTLVVSSTKGATSDHLTAILALANADFLIQMASMSSGAGRGAPGAGGPGLMGGMPGGGDMSGLSSLGLSGIMQ